MYTFHCKCTNLLPFLCIFLSFSLFLLSFMFIFFLIIFFLKFSSDYWGGQKRGFAPHPNYWGARARAASPESTPMITVIVATIMLMMMTTTTVGSCCGCPSSSLTSSILRLFVEQHRDQSTVCSASFVSPPPRLSVAPGANGALAPIALHTHNTRTHTRTHTHTHTHSSAHRRTHLVV